MTTILGIVKQNQLVPDETWRKFISTLAAPFDDLETNKERAKHKLASLLTEAVRKRLRSNSGILFSGGVDSSTIAVLAKELNDQPTCYTVGFEHSDDIAWAQKVAAVNGFALNTRILSFDELESLIKKIIEITKSNDIITVGVGCVTYAASQMAREDGCTAIMTGLGSEELFAGYERHLKSLEQGYEAVHRECMNGLQQMRTRDLTREFAIAQHLDIELLMPFLDKDVMKEALSLHPLLKLDKRENKIILRETAERLGLQKEYAWRKKQAAQYGSSVMNGIEKLTRRKGYATKKEYLQSLV
jgi:asparagine synthase (glutamine-hydrolysing)